MRNRLLIWLCRVLISVCLLLGVVASVSAETFPARTVTIVSPYQAGGTSDIIARTIAEKLTQMWSVPVVVENRPGANGAIGVQAVARAPADGHTLLAVASSALTINPMVFQNIAYDVKRDLAPIARTGQVVNVLVAHPSVPAKTVAELVALAKAQPERLIYASQGTGSNGHLIGEMFKLRAGVDLLHLPYKGSAPAVNDLIGGHVQLMFDNLPTALPQIRAGNLRALAVTSAARTSQLPDVPTLGDSGLPGFDASAWFAVLTAKNVPDTLQARLQSAVIAVLSDPAVRAQLAAAGVDVIAEGAPALAAKIEADTAMWKDVISAAKIKVQ